MLNEKQLALHGVGKVEDVIAHNVQHYSFPVEVSEQLEHMAKMYRQLEMLGENERKACNAVVASLLTGCYESPVVYYYVQQSGTLFTKTLHRGETVAERVSFWVE